MLACRRHSVARFTPRDFGMSRRQLPKRIRSILRRAVKGRLIKLCNARVQIIRSRPRSARQATLYPGGHVTQTRLPEAPQVALAPANAGNLQTNAVWAGPPGRTTSTRTCAPPPSRRKPRPAAIFDPQESLPRDGGFPQSRHFCRERLAVMGRASGSFATWELTMFKSLAYDPIGIAVMGFGVVLIVALVLAL
jgi:hypothetical protein